MQETAYAVLFYDPENPSNCCYRFCAVRQKEEDYFVLGGGDTSDAGCRWGLSTARYKGLGGGLRQCSPSGAD